MENEELNIERIKNHIKELENADIKYVIGIDSFNGVSSYCLVLTSDNPKKFPPRVLLCKKDRTDKEFKEEYENLAKYFNAHIIRNNNGE